MNQNPLDIRTRIERIAGELIAFRRDLHAHPELACEEHRTAAKVVEQLGAIPALRIRSGLAGTGVVAVLNADHTGRCIALRADMDALPLAETGGQPHASVQDGKMHACGHDGHVACLVGAARVLAEVAGDLPGKVKFLFQPSEEGDAGATKMIEAGVLDAPKVDALFGFHAWPENDLGSVAVGRGPVMAGDIMFDLLLRGPGTHAAYPHRGSDLIAAASQIVTALQAIPARRTDPVEAVVVSICQVHGGETYNVLPESCSMKGTIRALRGTTLDSVGDQVRSVAETIAANFGAEAEMVIQDVYPPVVNDARCAALVEQVGRELLGQGNVVSDPPPSMAAEDFAFYAQRVPAAFYRLGIRPTGVESYPALHNPNFDFNDDAIATGVAMHCGLVHRFLADPPAFPCG